MGEPSNHDSGALSPIWNLVQQVADMYDQTADRETMDLVSLTIETPIELDIVTGEDGRVIITSAPPTQQIETTFMPVFHGMRATVTPKDASSRS